MKNKKTSVSAPANGTGDGETRVEIERRIDEAYYAGNTKKAMKIAQRAYEAFKKTSNNPGMAYCLKMLGQYYNLEGNETEAVETYYKALELYKELDDAETLADIYNILGQLEPNTVKALELFDYQLSVLQKAGEDRYAISWCYECMAQKYEEGGDFRNALAAYNTIIDLFEKDNSTVKYIMCHADGCITEEDKENEPHIASIQSKMARVYGMMEEYDKAFELYLKVLDIHNHDYKLIWQECGESYVYNEMGLLELGRKNYRMALEHFERSYRSYEDQDVEMNMEKARQMMNWTEKYSKIKGGK